MGSSHEPQRRRLTPTCVGRTSGATSALTSSPAHPHVRGEDWVGA